MAVPYIGLLKSQWTVPIFVVGAVLSAGVIYLRTPAFRETQLPAKIEEPVNAGHHGTLQWPSASDSDKLNDSGTRYDMSFPGIISTCTTQITESKDVKDESRQLVNITYNICCRNGELACRTASKPLSIPRSLVQAIEASGSKTVDLAALDLAASLFFVTGASGNHFAESMVLLNSIQKFFPCSQTLYWDIGLNKQQAEQVQSVCGVTYKKFDFSKYPPHVATLTTYAFKPLIIMESLMECRALWWVDSSVRFTSNDLDEVFKLLKERHGLLMFIAPHHSVWSTTYPQMYEYVATDPEKLKDTVTAPGTSFIVVNTKELFSTLLYWFYACVSDARCIAPVSYPEYCPDRGLVRVFGHCHRFDQSLLTILAANIWGFTSDRYRYNQTVFMIDRSSAGDSKVQQCTGPRPLPNDVSKCVLRPVTPK